MSRRYTIAVDFDGVLHSYTSPWTDAHTIPDPPVEGAIDWLALITEKLDVVIFTTRGATEKGRLAVQAWLARHAKPGQEHIALLPVTAEKPPALI